VLLCVNVSILLTDMQLCFFQYNCVIYVTRVITEISYKIVSFCHFLNIKYLKYMFHSEFNWQFVLKFL